MSMTLELDAALSAASVHITRLCELNHKLVERCVAEDGSDLPPARELAEELRSINSLHAALRDDYELLRASLREIATRPTIERNPDGVDQAADTMQLIAREALGFDVDTGGSE